MSTNTVEIIDKGLKCLSENMGARETEIFIATILRERFDYTEWRRSLVEGIRTFDDLDNFVSDTNQIAKFGGEPKVVI